MALLQATDSSPIGTQQAPRSGTVSGWVSQHSPILILGLVLVLLPAVAGDFILVQVAGWALILGMIALSLMFLAGYGGMVSLAQMTVAGVAGYMVAVFGTSSLPNISLFWPWWVAAPVAIAIAVAFGTFVGALSARTEGIYTIMITLAIASAFFYFTNQNWVIFNGHTGINTVVTPHFWGVEWRADAQFYYGII